jgi:3-isopropylmalate dehydratase small subunit
MSIIQGRVRKFGDDIDTDTIAPGPSLHLPLEEMKKHAFAPIRPDFHETVRAGDVIVAGKNFGCGSSREQATAVVREMGIRTIVCESMARIYFRNAIALGLYPILSKGVSHLFEEGDEVAIDLETGRIVNPVTGKASGFEPLSGTPKEIFDGGGIRPVLKKILGAK